MTHSGDRRIDPARYADLLSVHTLRSEHPATALCVLAAETMRMSGAGLAIARGGVLECVAASDEVIGQVEGIEYTVGEGPCVSAHRVGTPVGDSDLETSGRGDWPLFRRALAGLPVGAVFGFPLLGTAGAFGSLNLYRRVPGAMSAAEHTDALVVTGISADLVLDWQAIAAPDEIPWQLDEQPGGSVQIHQATGRIAVQADVSIADALALLRAYAFSNDRQIVDVAREVATGNLRIV